MYYTFVICFKYGFGIYQNFYHVPVTFFKNYKINVSEYAVLENSVMSTPRLLFLGVSSHSGGK